MKRFLRVARKTMKVIFIVFCVYVGSLFFRRAQVPGWMCRLACEKLSDSETVVNFEGVTFGMWEGICIERLRVFGLKRKNPMDPILAAEMVSVKPFSCKVKIVGLKFPRLHDGYYDPSVKTESSAKDGTFSFPRLPAFDLVLVRPEILGVAPARVTAEVSVEPLCLEVGKIHLTWPDADAPMALDGECIIDLEAKRVHGHVEGLAKQHHIRPMLGDYKKAVTLDVPVALPYMDAFTEVTKPVPASCAWDVNLDNCAFKILIRLKPELGRYNGVALKEATGGITVNVWWAENGEMQYATSVDVDSSCDRMERPFNGHLTVWGTNGVRVVTIDAKSALKKQDTLDIIGYLNTGLLDCFECETPPVVSAQGVLATYNDQQNLNNLHGRLACTSSKFFGVAVSNVTTRFDYVGDAMRFPDVVAYGRTGGRIACDATLRFPGYDDAKATYEAKLDYQGSIDEVADVFKFDLGRRHGKVKANIHLGSYMFTNGTERLNGGGHVEVRDGHLAQMKLFAGLTELLAEKVPGVGQIVNQSDGSGDFTIVNGVLTSKNIRIEGRLFSISAEGKYDIVKGGLDFVVRVRLMKDDSVTGLKEFVRVLSWPFSKLLMEFRVKGTLDEPKWEYVSLLDRVM